VPSCLAENPGARPGQLARLLRPAPSSVATLILPAARGRAGPAGRAALPALRELAGAVDALAGKSRQRKPG
jgi:hypothetical protein